MGITAFRQIDNRSGQVLRLQNGENHGNSVTVQPQRQKGIEVWIPWAASEADFVAGHRLTIGDPKQGRKQWEIVNPRQYIWQQGDEVLYSADYNWHNGECVPGICAINGDRRLIIHPDLNIEVQVIR